MMKTTPPVRSRSLARVLELPTLLRFTGMALLLWLLTAQSVAAQQERRAVSDTASTWLQDMRLVFGASRYAQDVREAPASVTLITAEEIQRYGYRSLADVLGAARGMFTHYDRAYEYVTVRGLSRQSDYNTRVQILLDGHRINDAATDAAGIGTDGLVDLDLIDHVEIIHGPGSALFGTSAFFGVVNVVTKRGRQLQGLRTTLSAGSFDTYRGALTWGSRRGAREVLLSTSVEERGGRDLYFAEYDDSSTNNGVAKGLDGNRTYRAFLKAGFGDLLLTTGVVHRSRGIPTGAYGALFNDTRSRIHDRTVSAAVSYEHPFEDLSRLALSTVYDMYSYDGAYPYEQALFRDFNTSQAVSLEGQYLRLVGAGSKLTLGGKVRAVTDADIGAYDVDPRETYVAVSRSTVFGALYAQFEWRLGNNLISYTGVRHDRYQTFGGTTNPRTSLVYHPFERTWLKAHYGQAFRAPNLYELYYEDGGLTQKPAQGLRPERVATAELSIEQDLALGLRGVISAYDVRTKELINLVTDPVDEKLVFVNESDPHSRGVEVEVERRSHAGVEARLSYAYQKAHDHVTDALVNSPRHVLRAGTSVPIVNSHSRLAFEARHLSSRLTLNGSEAPAYTLIHATFTMSLLGSGTELTAQVRNLLGETYVEPAGAEHVQNVLAQDGRELRLGIKRRF